MDKNIIKDYLNKAFLTEAKQAKPKDNDGKTAKVKEEPTQEKKSAKGAQDVPGVKVTSKVNKESGKSNKEGVNAIAKEMEAYEKPLTKPDANSSEMATNKFDYNSEEEKTYHDDMEIMNGMEMLQYDRTPDEQFKTRALEAIEGSSKMGNNPDWANVVEKGWGGDKEFGKDLAKRIKASVKKRDEQTPTSKMFGNDWEVIKDEGNRAYAFENTNKKSTIKEFGEQGLMNELSPELKRKAYFDSEEQAGNAWDANQKGLYNRRRQQSDTFNSHINPTLQPLGDSVAKQIDPTFKCIIIKSAENNVVNVYFTPSDWRSAPIVIRVEQTGYKIEKGDAMLGNVDRKFDNFLNKVQASEIIKLHENQNALQESNKNKKQPMKRLKFKKEFKGVGNALKLIPESYKVDNKVFEMTDGNESYKVRWEGSLTEGAAVVLTASDKKMVNEDMDRMKALFNYKSQDTLGLVKGKARVDENITFTDIWNKTKKLLGESEDIDGQKADAEGEWDDAGVTHAPEAKKHMVQTSKMENGHQAPKPKEGQWAEIKPSHAADAKKHIQGSVSTDNGHQAPAPKQGHWDEIKIKGTTGVKGSGESNVKSQSKKPSVGEFSDVKKHAPEASKDIQGSTSNDKGTKAPAPKKGNWDDAKKGQATEAAKHIKKK